MAQTSKTLGPISNLAQYLDAVSALLSDWASAAPRTVWFRGHADSRFQLVPSMHRGAYGLIFERDMSRDFRLMSPTLLSRLPDTELGWMYLMQHYGLPTRLLDWTASHLVALFFAVEGPSQASEAVVWVLRPGKLNLAVLGDQTITTEDHPGTGDYLLGNPHLRRRSPLGEKAIAIRPNLDSRRIVAQRGGFTLHGAKATCLDQIVVDLERGTQIEIPIARVLIEASARNRLLQELSFAGITHSVVFPELTGIAQELKLRYSELFISKDDAMGTT